MRFCRHLRAWASSRYDRTGRTRSSSWPVQPSLKKANRPVGGSSGKPSTAVGPTSTSTRAGARAPTCASVGRGPAQGGKYDSGTARRRVAYPPNERDGSVRCMRGISTAYGRASKGSTLTSWCPGHAIEVRLHLTDPPELHVEFVAHLFYETFQPPETLGLPFVRRRAAPA